MYELTYKSSAHTEINNKDIDDILNAANRFNSENKITGCLVFYDNHFIQILEGERNIVKKLFSKISLDPRHTNVQLISENIKDTRFFSDWNMVFTDISKNESQTVEVKNYANNLLLLSEFMDKPTTALKMFWAGITRLIINPAI